MDGFVFEGWDRAVTKGDTERRASAQGAAACGEPR